MQVRKRLSSGQINLQNLQNLQGMGYPPIYGSNNQTLDKRQLATRYGELFAEQLFKLDVGQWSDTMVSGVGTHLVWVSEVIPETMPELEEVITQVRYAWFEYKSQQIKTRVYNQLKSQYEIVLESNKLDVDKYEQTRL
jgi:parvulin-like peptidyl-prolyl isomerase